MNYETTPEYYDRRIDVEDYIRVVDMLIKAGANPFLTDQEGRTPAAVAWQQAALAEQAGDDERQRKFQELARFLDAFVLACRH